jgi:NADPH-dependent curcumin reductase CurA
MRAGGVGIVLRSTSAQFRRGDHVTGWTGVCNLVAMPAAGLTKLPAVPGLHPTAFLSVVGMTGLTAYFGVVDILKPPQQKQQQQQQQHGEHKSALRQQTMLVSAASGAVGSIVGQIGKLYGCRVVGTAGTQAKCDWLTGSLGFDAAICYKAPRDPVTGKPTSLSRAVRAACPHKVDMYFDNVGGPLLDIALAQIAKGGRIAICGAISNYNKQTKQPGPSNYMSLLINSASMTGFTVMDKFRIRRQAEGIAQLARWTASGQLQHKEHVERGIARFVDVLNLLWSGGNTGKLILQIDEPMPLLKSAL